MAEPREITKAEYARILAGQAAGEEIAETGIVTPGATEIIPPDTKPSIADRMGKAFQRTIDEQGGWGISDETRKKIGFAGILPKSNPASLLLDLPANAVDAGARVLQGAMAGGSALAEGADALTQKAGLDVRIPGVTPDSGFLPGSLAKELIQAFPTGSPTTGLTGGARFLAPKNDIMEPARRAATNAEAKAMFDRGASVDELQEWAKANGMKPFGPEIDEAVRVRDSMTVRTPGPMPPKEPVKGQAPPMAAANDGPSVEAPSSKIYNPANDVDADLPRILVERGLGLESLGPNGGRFGKSYMQDLDDRIDKLEEFVDSANPSDPRVTQAEDEINRLWNLRNRAGEAANTNKPMTAGDRLDAALDNYYSRENDIPPPEGSRRTKAYQDWKKESKRLDDEKQAALDKAIDEYLPTVDDATLDYHIKNNSVLTDKARLEVERRAAQPQPTPEPQVSNGPIGAPKTEAPASRAEITAPETVDSIVARLTDAIKAAGPVTAEQQALLSDFRKQQAQAMLEARGGKVGEASLNAELGALKGSAPKASFAPVKDKFTQVEVDTLFDSLRENPALSGPFNQLNARTALRKLLEGEVPTPSELELLQKAMPADFIKAAMSRRPAGEKAKSFLEDLVNLPKTMLATGDLSAPLRQGVFLVGRKEFYTAFPEMFKEFARAWKANDAVELPKRGQNWKSSGSQVFDDIQARPTYDLMERAKLALTRPDGLSLNSREEAFQSRWAEKIPGFGRLVKGSEAAYSGFLNKLRADTFDDLVKKATANGVDLEKNEKALKDIAKFVNAATGRGNLAGTFEQGAALLNGAFFSPRLMSSRLSLINPAFYAKLDPTVRKEAVKSLLSFAGIAGTVAGLSALGGAEVETDMRSSKFGRVKFGNVSQDLTGGFNGYLTLLARVLTNEKKTANGDVVPLTGKGVTPSKLDLVETFFENKLAPVPGYVRDMLKGKDPGGNEFDAVGDAAGMFIPLFAQDVSAAIAEGSGADIAMMVPGFFGSSARFEGPKKDADGVRTITKEEYEELLLKSQGQDAESPDAQGQKGPREISLQEYEEILNRQ